MRIKAIDILRDVRDLLSDPNRWTAGEYARDSRGRETDPCDEQAVTWCLQGAVYACGAARGLATLQQILRKDWDPAADWAQPLLDALNTAAVRSGFTSFLDANDAGGRETALRVIEAALVDLESCALMMDRGSTSRRSIAAQADRRRPVGTGQWPKRTVHGRAGRQSPG